MRKWLPLAPAGTPGVWFQVHGMIPTRAGGYYTQNNDAAYSGTMAPSSPGTALRAWCALLPSDSAVAYIGTTTKLWQYATPATLTDRSKVGNYTNTATDWSFAQYGNISFATNRVDAVQYRDATTSDLFADLSAAPKASILVTQAEQLLAFDLNDGAEKRDAFATSAPGDYTDWTGLQATVATRLRHRPGGIRAAVAFRNYVLVFKRSSVYRLTYTGGTFKWQVELLCIGRGCYGKHDAVVIGDEVVFAGPGGAWRFDGASFRSIADWFGEPGSGITASLFAPLSGNVFFAYSPGSGGTPTTYKAYNAVSDAWGASSYLHSNVIYMTGESAALSVFVGPTRDLPDALMFVTENLTSVHKTTARWNGEDTGVAPLAAYVVGGVEGIGGDTATHFDKLIPNYTFSLSSASGLTRPANDSVELTMFEGPTKDADPIVSLVSASIAARKSSTTQRRFDVNRAAAYARFKINFNGAGYQEIDDYALKASQTGEA